MANIGIDNYIAKLGTGLARPNLFLVYPGQNRFFSGKEEDRFFIESSKIPEQTLGTITVPYMGRQIKVPGDRTFSSWNIDVIVSNNWDLRNRFEAWSEAMIGHETNLSKSLDMQDFFSDWAIVQLDRSGKAIAQYNMVGCWVSSVGEIALGWSNNDQYSKFTVTLEYQYWTRDTGTRNLLDIEVNLNLNL